MAEESSEFENDKLESSTADEIVLYTSKNTVVKKFRTFGKWQISKEIAPEFAFDAKHRQSLNQEFEIGFQLDHPNIVRYIDKKVSDDGVPRLILEYIDGSTLRELLDSDTCVSQKEFDSIFGAILSALSYLHRRQIYHLDVKPENIVVTHKEHVAKLIDFGFAITASNEKTLGTSKKYVAPEFSERTDDITGQTDMYAFAKTMQEFAEVKSISLSKRQKRIIKSALQQDVSQRITADKALSLLQKPQHRGWIVLLLLLVIVAVVTLLYMNNGEKLSETEGVPDTIFVEKQTVPDTNTTHIQDTTGSKNVSAPVIIQVKKESYSVGNSSQVTLPLTYANISKVKYNDEDSLYVVHEVEKYSKLQSRLNATLQKSLQRIEQRMDNGEITVETSLAEMEAESKQWMDSSNVYSEQMHRSIQKYLRDRYDDNDIYTYNYYSNEFVGKLIKKEIEQIQNGGY